MPFAESVMGPSQAYPSFLLKIAFCLLGYRSKLFLKIELPAGINLKYPFT